MHFVIKPLPNNLYFIYNPYFTISKNKFVVCQVSLPTALFSIAAIIFVRGSVIRSGFVFSNGKLHNCIYKYCDAAIIQIFLFTTYLIGTYMSS